MKDKYKKRTTNTLTCPTCRTTGHIKHFEPHQQNKGVWCPVCQTFIWFNPEENNQHITLLLEQKTSSANAEEVKNILPTTLNKRISPLRYPGGKSKIINYLFTKLQVNKCDTFVEVFAGGCSFGLSLLDARIIKHLVINDKDRNLIIFWNEVLNNPQGLINKLKSVHPTHADYNHAKELLSSNVSTSPTELAWAYLLVNRLSYSGIQKAGCMGGKNGSNEALLSRYNPERLIKQIERISELKDRITVFNQDYIECIEEYYWDDKTTLFIDPPYYEKGKILYNHYFIDQNHRTLSELVQSLTSEFPGCADILITYDDTAFIKNLYPTLPQNYINRKYSI